MITYIAAVFVQDVLVPSIALSKGGFYTKYMDLSGVPVLGSPRVEDRAVVRAQHLLKKMTECMNPAVMKSLTAERCTFSIIAEEEGQTDLPEYAELKNDPRTDWNARARGLGGRECSAGEENILEFPTDRYKGESIIIHEFSHTLDDYGFRLTDKSFATEIKEAFEYAKAKKLWEKTYALTNESEYFAEGVQSYFDCNRSATPANGIHNDVCNRKRLKEYDAKLFAVIDRVFGRNQWRYDGQYCSTDK